MLNGTESKNRMELLSGIDDNALLKIIVSVELNFSLLVTAGKMVFSLQNIK